jgi:REP element-mobilizing transposase RayT
MPASRQPLVIAHHLMWTPYGWWLPNDLRGSTSHSIRNDLIAELGKLHFGRRKVQPASCDIRAFYATARQALAYPLLRFASEEFAAVAAALGEAFLERKYTCYACAVMPDHIHLLIRKHRDSAEEMIDHLQSHSRLRLSAANLRTTDHPTWTRGGWKVFLDHPDEVRRTIHYIEANPLKWRLPRQVWDFVVPYDDWPLHVGHSVNSPYVQALRAAGRYPR